MDGAEDKFPWKKEGCYSRIRGWLQATRLVVISTMPSWTTVSHPLYTAYNCCLVPQTFLCLLSPHWQVIFLLPHPRAQEENCFHLPLLWGWSLSGYQLNRYMRCEYQTPIPSCKPLPLTSAAPVTWGHQYYSSVNRCFSHSCKCTQRKVALSNSPLPDFGLVISPFITGSLLL